MKAVNALHPEAIAEPDEALAHVDAALRMDDAKLALGLIDRMLESCPPSYLPLRRELNWRRAAALLALGNAAEARLLTEAIERAWPDHTGANLVLARALAMLGQHEASAVRFEHLYEANPASTFLAKSLARQLRLAGHVERALAVLEGVAGCGDPEIDLPVGIARMRSGDWVRGLPLFEARLFRPNVLHVEHPTDYLTRQPLSPWIAGAQPAALSVFAEQGDGDVLNFLPLITRLQRSNPPVRLFAPARLLPILENRLEGVELHDVARPIRARRDEHWAPLLSLLKLTDMRPEDAFDDFRPRLEVASAKIKTVGLIWQANPKKPSRSISLESLSPLFDIPGLTFVSLQHQAGIDQIDTFSRKKQLATPLRQTLANSEMLSAFPIVTDVDVVVAVDTGLAHLAGAMGKRVCLLLEKEQASWRWMDAQKRAPWYSDTMIYRQEQQGDWSDAVLRLRNDLAVARNPRSIPNYSR